MLTRYTNAPSFPMHPAGIEPATARLSTACCRQLSYRCKLGCKDSNPDLQLQRLRSSRLDDIPPHSKSRASDGVRTRNLLGHNQAHLPIELHPPERQRRIIKRFISTADPSFPFCRAPLPMLPPGFEPGSCARPALTGYKPAALPVELQEPRTMLPPGLEPGPCTDLVLTRHARAALAD
jgi:hypothetical protein